MHLISQKSSVGGYTASDFKANKLVCLISDKKGADSVGWEGGHGSSRGLNFENGREKKQACELTFPQLGQWVHTQTRAYCEDFAMQGEISILHNYPSVTLQNQGSRFATLAHFSTFSIICQDKHTLQFTIRG